jgi:SAM-dependent methyltransferase
MQRVLQPEILDSLPADDPAAVHSRRDLRLINRLMGNHRWLAATLPRLMRPGERALEIGAGTGELCFALSQRGVDVDGLDRCPKPAAWPSQRTWHEADLTTFDRYSDYSVIVANLVLHHFTSAALAGLGARLDKGPRLICACEPARLRRHQTLFALLAPFLGVNSVTRHDARVSIAAGFRGDELSRELGLRSPDWSVTDSEGPFGSHRMVAIKRPTD